MTLRIYALLLDICIGGMRIVSTDKRIGDSETISLSVNNFRVELPCEKTRRIEYQYGITFGSIDKRQYKGLVYFIEHFTKEPRKFGLIEIMK